MTHSLVFIFPTGTFSSLPVLLYFTIHNNRSPISLSEIVWNEIRRFIDWNKNSWMPECCPLDKCKAIILIESSILYGIIQSRPSDYPQSTSVHLNWSPWDGLRKSYLRISRKMLMMFTELLCLLIYSFLFTACSWFLRLWLKRCQITLFFSKVPPEHILVLPP